MPQNSSVPARLALCGLGVSAPDGTEILKGIDLTIGAGEVLCLLGPSGAGKSVLGRVVLRLDLLDGNRITAGRVWLDGRDVTALPPAELRQLRGGLAGMVFQDAAAALTPGRCIGAQLIESLRLQPGMRRGEARAQAHDWLRRVELGPEVMQAYPHELSGGMAQRVMLALALARGPKLLIADEATTALDPVTQAGILDLIDRLRREEGLAVLLITHDAGVARRLADRVARIEAGRIVGEGPVAEMLGSAPVRSQAGRAPETAPWLRAEGLCLDYPARGGGRKAALRDVALELRRGECLALIGPSGAGKTSLARALLGIERLSGGQVRVADRVLLSAGQSLSRADRARFQMIFQDPLQSFDARRSLGAQIADSLCNFGVTRPEAEERATALSARLGLDAALLTRRPGAVSGGQRQRAAMARALIFAPELLIADEALSALDPVLRAEMVALLQAEQAARGMALLLISHDMALVAELAHRVAVVAGGEIVEEGPAAEVLRAPRHAVTRALLAEAGGMADA